MVWKTICPPFFAPPAFLWTASRFPFLCQVFFSAPPLSPAWHGTDLGTESAFSFHTAPKYFDSLKPWVTLDEGKFYT